jgi:DNA-binding PadR family transcriptional regulator
MARSPDLVGLTVLALLSIKPSHPYEMHRFILDTHKDYVTGLPRSLYHAVDRLVRDELIVPLETSREGRRPERTVYELSDEGRAELATRLRRLLTELRPDTRSFLAAVSLMGCLPVSEVERALLARAGALESTVFSCDVQMKNLQESGLPRLLMLELECERALRHAELEWVRSVLEGFGSGQLTWSEKLKLELLGEPDEEDSAV